MVFPINIAGIKDIRFSLDNECITPQEISVLTENIRLFRDTIVFMTALAGTKGLGGHTGGAYDITPELLIAEAFIRGGVHVFPVLFDEAGHRVAAQYALAVLRGYLKAENLMHYREYDKKLYGHPERDDTRGIFFSSGRLGHLWSHVNGVALADRRQSVFLFGSDGSQQEGNCAEAARFAVANRINVKLVIDDNDATIAGHTSQYMRGFSIAKTLIGHGLMACTVEGEDCGALYAAIRKVLLHDGPAAIVVKRPMAPGIAGIEGSPRGHDVIPVDLAVAYLEERGYPGAVRILHDTVRSCSKSKNADRGIVSAKSRDDFGTYVCARLRAMDFPEKRVLVVDSDLEGSCGLHHIGREFPGLYYHAGIMERNNFSVAAGFGASGERQGIFATFSAFLEMVISEITMARLNRSNVLAHFSHAGVDEMADNTCHFGINIFFADNGLYEDDRTMLLFPADTNQMRAMIDAVFDRGGIRFMFSTRSATPVILNESGEPFFGGDYRFVPGVDEVIMDATEGYVISYGEMLHRSLAAVRRLQNEGVDIGLINKPTLNMIDENMMRHLLNSKFVFVVEGQNEKSGLGARFGTWLLRRGYAGLYRYRGVTRAGCGGLGEQIIHQGLDPDALYEFIMKEVRQNDHLHAEYHCNRSECAARGES
jgi:transketolase